MRPRGTSEAHVELVPSRQSVFVVLTWGISQKVVALVDVAANGLIFGFVLEYSDDAISKIDNDCSWLLPNAPLFEFEPRFKCVACCLDAVGRSLTQKAGRFDFL